MPVLSKNAADEMLPFNKNKPNSPAVDSML
jgi:hypothetical protein